MSAFETAEEWGDFFVGFLNKMMSDPVIGPKMLKSNISLRYNYTDPDFSVFVDLTGGSADQIKILPGDTESEAMLEMTMTVDVGHKYWCGKLNPMVALTSGKIKAKGAIGKAMKLQPVMKLSRECFNAYIDENEKYHKYKL
jgi:putative sterol carrier protein